MEQQFRESTGLERTESLRISRTTPVHQWPSNLPAVDICAIGAIGFSRNLAQPGTTAFATSLYKIDWILEEKASLEIQEDQDYQVQMDLKLLVQY